MHPARVSIARRGYPLPWGHITRAIFNQRHTTTLEADFTQRTPPPDQARRQKTPRP